MSRRKDEQGAIAVMSGMIVVVLCLVAAFTVDIGLAYSAKVEAQAAADSGALAAAAVYADVEDAGPCSAAVIADHEADALAAAQEYRDLNYDAGTISGVEDVDFEVTCDPDSDGFRVEYTVRSDTATFFGGLAGSGDVLEAEKTAVALVDVPPQASGLRPLALCSSNMPAGLPEGVIRVDGPSNGQSGNSGGPAPTDTDKGGVSDAAELLLGTDPNTPKKDPNDDNPDGDPDGDGLTNAEEGNLGSDPTDPDTDDDGVDDGEDLDPTTAAICPQLAEPGNWWTVRCPGDTGQNDLATAVLEGCAKPIKIVEGQAGLDATALSTHLRDECDTESSPANCLDADTGQINSAGLLAAFDSLIANQTEFLLPVFCGPPDCSPIAVETDSAGQANYPIHRMVGVTLCGYYFGGSNASNLPAGCGSYSGEQGQNFVLIQIRSLLDAGSTEESVCDLGEECDGGVRRIRLVE